MHGISLPMLPPPGSAEKIQKNLESTRIESVQSRRKSTILHVMRARYLVRYLAGPNGSSLVITTPRCLDRRYGLERM